LVTPMPTNTVDVFNWVIIYSTGVHDLEKNNIFEKKYLPIYFYDGNVKNLFSMIILKLRIKLGIFPFRKV